MTHTHGPGCGHTAVEHDGHVDYVHDGELHHPTDRKGNVDRHHFAVDATNPAGCTPGFQAGHAVEHHHGPNCGHVAIPHGDHTDYIVEGRLHSAHGDHCDDHGPVNITQS